jgi:hypothetical protein
MAIMRVFKGKMSARNEKITMRRGEMLWSVGCLHIWLVEKLKSIWLMKSVTGKVISNDEKVLLEEKYFERCYGVPLICIVCQQKMENL